MATTTVNGIHESVTFDTARATGEHEAQNSGDLTSLLERYQHAKYADKVKNDLIEDVLTRYDNLLRKHNDYVEEHKQERELAQTQLEREEQLHGNIVHLQRLLNRDAFIVLLVDGDGMIFNRNLLNAGEAGGEEAASILYNTLVQWAVADVAECPADVKVVVRIYANIKGLADVCFRAGLVDAPDKVRDFARGFTRGKPLLDFTDVGGKDRADWKIIETLKLHLFDYQCRQVLFGCSHDNSYARMLRQYTGDAEVHSRLTLLEGIPFEKDFASLPFNATKFTGIFRGTLIPGQTDLFTSNCGRVDSRNSVLNATSGVFTPRTSAPSSLYDSNPNCYNVTIRDASLGSRSAVSSTSDLGSATWSVVTAKNAHLPLTDKTSTALLPEARSVVSVVKRNKHSQRIDADLEYNRDEVQRIKKLKSCNQHYIGIGCCHYNAGKADKCPHNHHFKFSPVELKALRVVARETPCKKGHDCDDAKCIYGHHCPFPVATEGSMRGVGCLNGDSCRFPRSMHGMDTVPVRTTRISGAF